MNNIVIKIPNPANIPHNLTDMESGSVRGLRGGATWEHCGNSNDPVQVTAFSMTPDPVGIPGDVTISVSITVPETLEGPLKLETVFWKKILFFWVKLGCYGQIGTCTHDDICGKSDQLKCPIQAGVINVPPTTYHINYPSGVPSFVLNGYYSLELYLKKGDKELGCLKTYFSISS